MTGSGVPDTDRGPARRWAAGGRLGVMNTISAYLINAILVPLVVRQIREQRLDLRSLAVPALRTWPNGGLGLFPKLYTQPSRA